MPDMQEVASYLAEESGLAVVSTTQADGRVLSSVVNCGVVEHPTTGAPCVALVSMGSAARIGHVRRGSEVTIAIRRGWRWLSVTGPADLIGPLDNAFELDPERIRILLRDIFTSAGGDHDDWDAYDQTMRDEARTAVLIAPEQIRGNG